MISLRSGSLSTFAVRASWSACSHGGTAAVSSVAWRTTSAAPELGPDRDHVVGTDLVAGDVDAAAVDVPVAVADQLARLAPRGGEAEADEDVVEAALEQAQQVLAGDALLARGLLVVARNCFSSTR